MSALDNLKKAAKRWLKALRANDVEAIARMRRVFPNAPAQPGLRDVQHALARELGHESWIALLRTHQTSGAGAHAQLVQDLLAAYHDGDDATLERLRRRYGRAFTLEELKAGVRRRLDSVSEPDRPGGVFALPHARLIVAREYGFDDWAALEQSMASPGLQATSADGPSAALEPLDVTACMIQPVEIRAGLPVKLRDGAMTTTSDVWRMLSACREGDRGRVHALLERSPQLLLCDYNYMSPLHLAVREGHLQLVRDLVAKGAANPNYVTYPYRETLTTVALDRGHVEIAGVLEDAYATADRTRPEDEGGEILYDMDDGQRRFQKLLNTSAVGEIEARLEQRPALARNPFAFWSEGVLMMPAKLGHRGVIELLMRYGARVPDVSKWGAWYYLWNYDVAALLLETGMDPNHTNCHHTTVLHDMAYKGDTRKAALLLDHGADINAIDEEFRSSPLGLAARWGHRDMAALLVARGADPNAAGAPWATPLAWAKRNGHAGVQDELRRVGALD
jgi:hypothetical protein